MLRILHIIPSLRKGGAERLVLNICNELQKRKDVVVKLIVLHPNNEYEFLSKNISIEFCSSRVLPSITGKNQVDISDFERIIADFNPEIIHSHLFEAEMLSRWKPLPNIKYITHCHDNMKQFRVFDYKTLLNKELFTNYYERNIIMMRYKKCDNKFIAISKDSENYLKRSLPKPLRKNIHLLNNAIDYNRFYFEKNPESLSNDTYNFVTVGSLVGKKNQLFLIEVIRLLIDKGVKCNLDIIGDGENRNIISQRISQLGLEKNIIIHGNVNFVEEYLKNSILYLHASTYEAFGLVLLEAMASGLPVICLDGKGNRDIIEEGKNGFMIYEQDPELFAKKIIEIIRNKQLYSSMSHFATIYAKNFDIKDYTEQLLKIYRN